MTPSVRRLVALCRKEALQIVRDPSTILIAAVLPVILMFLFGYGVNLDTGATRIGLSVQDDGAAARRLADVIAGSPYLEVVEVARPEQLSQALGEETIRGFAVIPQDFSRDVAAGRRPTIQIVTDGSVPNTAGFVANYVSGAVERWSVFEAQDRGGSAGPAIRVDQRLWFNPSAISRHSLLPGSIVIVMTMIGALLTSLVVAREWERGTMEGLLSTAVTRVELILSKFLPYFALGLGSMAVCVGLAVGVMGVPFRGDPLLLVLATSMFLGSALGLGLLLSTLMKNQFNAAQAALNAGFLPAMMLSGFVYEIASMPQVVQAVTLLFPARYFVTILQTLFLTDVAGRLFVWNLVALTLIAAIFIGAVALRTPRRLD
ncbi:ABC transporter permease [Brevundimonas sp.]|uniref:ABC transporter permease n=1 Tax=Brevundimonas sp. TaxID=1871086 RepID=UPI00257CDF3C|nr:ABC transporter permease [Brevundimonas sp.]